MESSRPAEVVEADAAFHAAERADGRAFRVAVVSLVVFGGAALAAAAAGMTLLACLAAALLAIGVGCLWKASNGQERAADALQEAYDAWLKGSVWSTPAGAEGVVTRTSCRGRRLELAFANGVLQTYDTASLTRLPRHWKKSAHEAED